MIYNEKLIPPSNDETTRPLPNMHAEKHTHTDSYQESDDPEPLCMDNDRDEKRQRGQVVWILRRRQADSK